jgi:fructan beta-fructosidase
VRTTGPRIQVRLDHGATPVVDATDTAYAAGRFGADAYAANTTARHLAVTDSP